MLSEEIETAKRTVRTDAYQMSIGEIVSMYDNHELIVDPEFQRLFRWNNSQKSKLVESLLLGIPIPSIFVFERDDGTWELIDGLQRTSTILEFMGKLRDDQGGLHPPSILDATKYLNSLHNAVWETSDDIVGVKGNEQRPLDKSQQLAIRRSRIGVEILKRPSDESTKYDLFQRLNAGGTEANAQELRNCIVLMVNAVFFRAIKAAADQPEFLMVAAISADQLERQRHIEWATRFLVHTYIRYDGKLDIQEYIDDGIVELARESDGTDEARLITRTFGLLHAALGSDALRRLQDGRHVEKVGLVGLEVIAVGVAKNLDAIERLQDPAEFVKDKVASFWQQDDVDSFRSPGLRGTTRIQRTVPYGERWFKP